MSDAIIPIIVVLLGSAIAAIGWSIKYYLATKSEKKNELKEKTKESAIVDAARAELIREVIEACQKRAIYTRMHAQLDREAMFRSLAKSRTALQKRVARIEPKNQQQLVQNIIRDLDFIERHSEDNQQINGAKKRIIAALHELSKAINISFTIPHSLTEEVFFSIEEADENPTGPPSRDL